MKRKLFKVAKILGFLAVALITLVALALAVENYRGKRAWDKCRAEFAAQGEVLDWTALAPPAVPDDQNFWKTPLLSPLSDLVKSPVTGVHELRNTNALHEITRLFSSLDPLHSLELGSWRLGQAVDLTAVQARLRGETNTRNPELARLLAMPKGSASADLLTLIDTQRSALEEVRTALERPYARSGFPVEEGSEALLAPLGPIRTFALTFQRRALANLGEGNPEAAAGDVLAGLRLARTLESEPILIRALVEFATVEAAIQPLWEGLARRQWQEPQLAALEAELARFDFVAGMARTLRFERAYSLSLLEGWRKQPKTGGAAGPENEPRSPMTPTRFPSGWVRLTQVEIARMFQDFLIPVMDTNRMVIDSQLAGRLQQQAEARLSGWHPSKILARMLFPAIATAWQKAARAQTAVSQARIAIALERSRSAAGSFPEQLAALSPRFLASVPHDALNAEPYRYRREAPDRYVLYSVGLNLADDGGEVAVTKSGRPNPMTPEGDWVWFGAPRFP